MRDGHLKEIQKLKNWQIFEVVVVVKHHGPWLKGDGGRTLILVPGLYLGGGWGIGGGGWGKKREGAALEQPEREKKRKKKGGKDRTRENPQSY